MCIGETSQPLCFKEVIKMKMIIDKFAPVIIAELADFHKSLNPEQRKKLADELNKHSHENRFEHGLYHGNH